ncbi:hypothetical protein C9374_014249 [Naegleria lovaniensis]|uniref:40S ribosomal protein S6 n=1 Tax=Naegleria lovaniensis TaxID=51637 RepID=A0AA88GAS6_NAELO|nr:uncharacterized protein C9374_014249 [Naegleria lovaniensis]KAG2370755.1 hypothetical protein C9374_014249 [Naegleria lovaniensis]
MTRNFESPYKVLAPVTKPLRKLDLAFGRGFDHMREDPDVHRVMDDWKDRYRSFLFVRRFQIASPQTGKTKTFEPIYESNHSSLVGRKIGDVIDGIDVSTMFTGYRFKISGASDSTGVPHQAGIFQYGRVRLLKKPGSFGYPSWRAKRKGSMKRKTVRGGIIDMGTRTISLVIVKNGTSVIPGLTDGTLPKTLAPKRASKIRKLFNLSKCDDVRKYVIKRNAKICGSLAEKGVKIQRLITPERIRRKQKKLRQSMQRALKRMRDEENYHKRFGKRFSDHQE